MPTFETFVEALGYYSEYGVSEIEAIEICNTFGKKLYSWEISSSCIKGKDNMKISPEQAYDLPESHNCRNCGAPVKGYNCEYCGTRY